MNEIKEELISILQLYTNVKLISDEIPDSVAFMNDIGISSIRRMDIILDIEEFYNIEFNEKELWNLKKISELIHLIRVKTDK